MIPYTYKELDDTKEEIRLITLRAGKFSDELHIRLGAAPFPSDKSEPFPEFEALSYVWGTQVDPVDIIIEDEHISNATLGVTQNLAEALPYLRYEDKDRILWIDAICINQKDNAERSSQVQRMADIFVSATSVVVWLGAEDETSAHAFDLLKDIATHVAIDPISRTLLPTSDASSDWADVSIHLPYDRDDSNTIVSLFLRPWFERLWVRQEIRLAKKATVMCGDSSLPWDLFCRAALCILGKYRGSKLSDQQWDNIYNAILPYDGYENLGLTIWNNRFTKCQDPKDRVFAILSLVHKLDRQAWSVKPDYQKSIAQVYEDATLSYNASQPRLDNLAFCNLDDRGSNLSLPSWVPDWSTLNRLPNRIPFAWASGGTVGHFERHGDRNLRAFGAKIGSIEKAYPLSSIRNASDKEVIEGIRRLKRALPPTVTEGHNGNLSDVLFRTLVVDHFQDRNDPAYLHSTEREEAFAWFSELIASGIEKSREDQSDSLNVRRYLKYIRLYTEQRSFFITDNGHLGLAPSNSKPTDIICVLFGCTNPLVLRPSTHNSDEFEIVGECYANLFMAGEAIWGPLPPSYKHVQKFNKEEGYYVNVFRNESTGEYEDDPRYALLIRDDLETQDWLKDVDRLGLTEEEQEKYRNLAIEAMKRRGVDPTWFSIV